MRFYLLIKRKQFKTTIDNRTCDQLVNPTHNQKIEYILLNDVFC